MDGKYNVLFLCRANAARSIMAEALLRQLAPEKFGAFSAGVEPMNDVHALTLAQLRPTIPELGEFRPKSWDLYSAPDAPQMDIVIAMSRKIYEHGVPLFPGNPTLCYWDFPDPLDERLTEAEQRQMFERVFRQILRRISVFVALPLQSMRKDDQQVAVNSAGVSL